MGKWKRVKYKCWQNTKYNQYLYAIFPKFITEYLGT